jgi:DegV family protein with EDD domain
MIRDFGLHILPTIFKGEDEVEHYSYLRDEVDLSAFYQRMEAGEVFTTSLINRSTCEEIIGPLLEGSTEDILYIVFSSGLTGTFDIVNDYFAEMRPRYPGRKLLAIDSLSASLGMGLIVYHAALVRAAGAGIDQVADLVRAEIPETCQWFTVQDLKYLKRGGRVSATSAAIGTVLDIKPVLHVNDNGELEPVAKVRGRKKSLTALVDHMQERVDEAVREQYVFISHANCPRDAQFVADLISERMGVSRFLINVIDPVIGAHSGPGTVALFFQGHPR